MKYEVEALDTYERLNISDNELKRIPKAGEKWEVSKERLDVLLGNNNYKEIFVKLVEKTTGNKIVDDMVKETGATTVKIKAVKKTSTKNTTIKK